jgi:hypothetical protein
VSLLLLRAYVQAEAFTPVLSEHATLTVPHVIAPVQSAVPENVMLADVAAHANPVVVSVPEHVALAAVTCTTSVPSEFRLTVSVTVTVPTELAVVHVPTSGLLLPELPPPHPTARTAIAADAATPQLSIVNGPSCLQTNGFLGDQDEHGKRNGATGTSTPKGGGLSGSAGAAEADDVAAVRGGVAVAVPRPQAHQAAEGAATPSDPHGAVRTPYVR